MPIYTRMGDDGDTAVAGGSRTSKASTRVEAYGAVDEATSAVGFARAAVAGAELDAVLAFVQQRFMNCAGSLATPASAPEASAPISPDDIGALETAIDRFSERAGGFSGFVLPSGGEAATRLQVARATTRRAERRAVALAAEEPVDALVLAFLNRASDLLFSAAGFANALDGIPAQPWDRDALPPAPGI